MPARGLSATAMGALLLASSMKHFRDPGFFRQVVPGYLCREDAAAANGRAPGVDDGGAPRGVRPGLLAVMSRDEWIAVSGLLELAAAVGILVPQARKATATCLAAMFTVFLAGHVDAVRHAYGPEGTPAERAIHTARLPLQVPLILWAWSLRNPARRAGA